MVHLAMEFERLTMETRAVTDELQALVMEEGKTQTVGNVRATYSAGRKTYHYEAGFYARYHQGGMPPSVQALMEEHKKCTYDFRELCRKLEIDAPYKQSPPTVTVKLLD